jgi:hypothetical protein
MDVKIVKAAHGTSSHLKSSVYLMHVSATQHAYKTLDASEWNDLMVKMAKFGDYLFTSGKIKQFILHNGDVESIEIFIGEPELGDKFQLPHTHYGLVVRHRSKTWTSIRYTR